MFVISRYLSNSCEVFDSISNKFTFVKIKPSLKKIFNFSAKATAVTVGYNIHVFKVKKSEVITLCVDVKQESWIARKNCNFECSDDFSCAKIFKH